MDTGLVELACLLIVAHDRLYLPALRIGLVDFRRLHVEIAFQDHRPEPGLPFLESGIVIVLRAAPDEVGLFLCGPSLVAEGIEEFLPSLHGLLSVENSFVRFQDSGIIVHRMPFRQLRVPFHRIEIMKLGVFLEALRRGRRRKALVCHDYSLLYAAFLDKIGICGHVEHVLGIALGTDRLPLLEIERIDDGNVPGALCPCRPEGDTSIAPTHSAIFHSPCLFLLSGGFNPPHLQRVRSLTFKRLFVLPRCHPTALEHSARRKIHDDRQLPSVDECDHLLLDGFPLLIRAFNSTHQECSTTCGTPVLDCLNVHVLVSPFRSCHRLWQDLSSSVTSNNPSHPITDNFHSIYYKNLSDFEILLSAETSDRINTFLRFLKFFLVINFSERFQSPFS